MSLTNQIRNSRRSSEGLPFELSLQSSASNQKALRTDDESTTKEFNADVAKWTREQSASLRSSVGQKIKRNISLSQSIKGKVYRKNKEAQRIGFSFLREGIYMHKGAGRGQGGLIGGSWIDPHGRRKKRAPESAGKMATGNRQENNWFDAVMDQKLPQLADIVGNYSAALQVDATKLYIDQ